MNDEKALKILNSDVESKQDYIQALFHAIQRLNEQCWHTYDPETFGNTYTMGQGLKVLLGIRYSDGSRGCVEGIAVPDVMKIRKLVIQHQARNLYTADAVIEKWMVFPDYTDSQL